MANPTVSPFNPPDGNDAAYARFPKDRRTLVSDGTTIAWTVLPADPGVIGRSPVVLANGWSCSDAYWVSIAPALTALGHPCLIFDSRGHGASGLPRHPGRTGSALHTGDLAIGRLADDLLEVASDAGLDRFVVLGHSMGVQTALETYRADPRRVAGLALLAGAYENPLRTLWGMPLGDLLFPFLRAAGTAAPELVHLALQPSRIPGLGHFLARKVRAAGPKATAADMQPYLDHIAAADPAVLLLSVAAMRNHSAADLLRRIEAPVLILAAGRDTFTPPACSHHLFERIPTAEIKWWPEAGHTLPIEEPLEIVDALDEWLTRQVEPVLLRAKKKPASPLDGKGRKNETRTSPAPPG